MFAFASITASILYPFPFDFDGCSAGRLSICFFFSSTFALPNGSKIHARKHARPIKCTITVRWFAAPWGFARLPSSTYEAMNLLFDFLSARQSFGPTALELCHRATSSWKVIDRTGPDESMHWMQRSGFFDVVVFLPVSAYHYRHPISPFKCIEAFRCIICRFCLAFFHDFHALFACTWWVKRDHSNARKRKLAAKPQYMKGKFAAACS